MTGYGKVGVIGAIARKGNVVCRVIGDTDARTLSGFVREVVSDRVSLLATDENLSYKTWACRTNPSIIRLASTSVARCIPTIWNRSGVCSSVA